jgi:hypothetical protein
LRTPRNESLPVGLPLVELGRAQVSITTIREQICDVIEMLCCQELYMKVSCPAIEIIEIKHQTPYIIARYCASQVVITHNYQDPYQHPRIRNPFDNEDS